MTAETFTDGLCFLAVTIRLSSAGLRTKEIEKDLVCLLILKSDYAD